MLIVHVHFHVKEGLLKEFKSISFDNAVNSRLESGVISFKILQQDDDKTRFIFIEKYKKPEDQLIHRETEHYKKWRSKVMDTLVEPYTFTKYIEL